jgi:diadenosine tetraphosphate (Ap4A) HIT family hydrolase
MPASPSHDPHCLTCRTLSGEIQPPGGILYENASWAVFLRARPLLTPAYTFVVLKRHCEELTALTGDEATLLGPTLQRTGAALQAVVAPARIHYGLYAEEVRHIHWHLLPRAAGLPPSHARVVLRGLRRQFLARLRLVRPFSDEEVARVAEQLRHAFVD